MLDNFPSKEIKTLKDLKTCNPLLDSGLLLNLETGPGDVLSSSLLPPR